MNKEVNLQALYIPLPITKSLKLGGPDQAGNTFASILDFVLSNIHYCA